MDRLHLTVTQINATLSVSLMEAGLLQMVYNDFALVLEYKYGLI